MDDLIGKIQISARSIEERVGRIDADSAPALLAIKDRASEILLCTKLLREHIKEAGIARAIGPGNTSSDFGCGYCAKEPPFCGGESDHWLCTRSPNHSPEDHIACGKIGGHELHRWPWRE